MRKLSEPVFTQTEVLEACISNMEDAALVYQIKEHTQAYELVYKYYNDLAKKNSLNEIEEGYSIGNLNTTTQINLYTNKFAKLDQPGRYYYNILMDLALDSMCSCCGYRPANTLDHVLAKTKFPALSINPLNLVPTCSDCNKKKFSTRSLKQETNYLHPYYDDIDDEIWLKAKLNNELPFTLDFYVNAPTSWDEIKLERTKLHFKRFSLNSLYKIYAGTEISAKIFGYKETFDYLGYEILQKDIERDFRNFERLNKNTWQYAFYFELATNEWFLREMLANSISDIIG